MYTYYYHIVFSSIKQNEEGKYIHNEIFKNIPHFIKNHIHVDFIQDGFVKYRDRLLIQKIEVITPVPGSMIPVDGH